MQKSYIWTAEVIRNENGKFDVWIGEENSTGCKYENLTPEEIGNLLTEDIKTVNEIWNEDKKEIIIMIFNKKEDFIKFIDLTVEACEASKCIDTEELLYESNKIINEYNKNNDAKYTCETLEYLVDTIRDAMIYKGYYIRPQTELDWNLSSFGTVFFKYKDKEMWCTTLVGQGSEDMIGFNHPGLSDEFELWAKTNPTKKDELFPNLENVINDYYKWREDKK